MNLKFRTKLYIVFSAVIIFSSVSFSLYIHMHIFGQMEQETTYNDQQLCIKISENVDTYVEKLDDITKKLISDPRLLQIMCNIKREEKQLSSYEQLKQERDIADIVSNAITLTSFPHVNVYLYDEDENCRHVYNQDKSNFKKIMASERSREQLREKKLVIFADSGTEKSGEDRSISFVRGIFDVSTNQYGYIEVQSDYKELDKICDINDVGDVILQDGTGKKIYPILPEEENVQTLIPGEEGEEHGGVFTEGEYIYFYNYSDYSGISTFIRYSQETLYSSLGLLQRTTVFFFIAVTAAAFLMVIIFSRMLVRPLQELRDNVLKVTYENMGLGDDDLYNNNEILELKEAFQKILDDLKQTAEREIASNQAEARARVAVLQAQISPHFIHNVLYSISIAAKEGRTEDSASMCKQLSDMLRYTVNSNAGSTRLKDEITCIANYLSLQKKYYEDFLEYELCIPEEIEDLRVPRLSILPFVENAIQHAFEGKRPPYEIEICAQADDGSWNIEIRDNGIGFSEDKIRELESRIQEQNKSFSEEGQENSPGMGGMGIPNCVLRLYLYIGEGFQFAIKNNASGEGTSVCLSYTGRWRDV